MRGWVVLILSLSLLSTATASAESVRIEVEDGGPEQVPVEAEPANHTDKDAECFTNVPILQSSSCTDSWNQAAGNFSADWHSTFHDLWTVGQLTLTVRDDLGRVVFRRDCQWLGATGICIVDTEPGVAGEWTMRLDAHVDATVGASSTAHGWFTLFDGASG